MSNLGQQSFTDARLWFYIAPCGIPEGCPQSTLPPGVSAVLQAPSSPEGILLDHAEHIAVSLFTYSSPQQTYAQASQLPVAREAEFTRKPMVFPFVSTYAGSRSLLRVYLLGDDRTGEIAVKIRRSLSATPEEWDAEVVLALQRGAGTHGYGQWALSDLFPEVIEGDATYHVEVEPLPIFESNARPVMWAFISITNNQTQAITVHRPFVDP